MSQVMKPRTCHRVLSIAGSDSSGGAGIQADLKTFAALGCYGMSVITAVTAQNTQGVTAVHGVPLQIVEAQLTAVMSDLPPDAVKIGMLYSGELIETIAEMLKNDPARHLVIDPVMAAHRGTRLLEGAALHTFRERLMPLATLVTPNLPEASLLAECEITRLSHMKDAARRIAAWGGGSVLIKGGHSKEKDCTDLLLIASENRFVTLTGPRIATRNLHGTGCTLPSAIAAFLAKGQPLEDAVRSAREYLVGAIEAAAYCRIGSGDGPLHHFYRFWK